MTEVSIDGARGTVVLRKGVLYVHWITGLAISEDAATAVLAAVRELSSGRPYPILVDIAAAASMSRGARRVFARPRTVARVALLGSSPVDRAMANFYLRLNSPAAPTRYFTCPDEALTWLRGA